jgi:hypothetical protein
MKLGTLRRIKITPNSAKTEFSLLLTFAGSSEPVEFSLPSGGLMLLLRALQELQILHQIPIPASLRPTGKPTLTIVTDDDA